MLTSTVLAVPIRTAVCPSPEKVCWSTLDTWTCWWHRLPPSLLCSGSRIQLCGELQPFALSWCSHSVRRKQGCGTAAPFAAAGSQDAVLSLCWLKRSHLHGHGTASSNRCTDFRRGMEMNHSIISRREVQIQRNQPKPLQITCMYSPAGVFHPLVGHSVNLNQTEENICSPDPCMHSCFSFLKCGLFLQFPSSLLIITALSFFLVASRSSLMVSPWQILQANACSGASSWCALLVTASQHTKHSKSVKDRWRCTHYC